MRRLPTLARLRHRQAVTRLALATAFVALAAAAPSRAQDLVTVGDRTEMTQVPDASNSPWSRIGTAHAFLHEGTLVCNDNMGDGFIAFQGMLGQLQAEHAVEFRAAVKVHSNIGGQGAVVEVSRPGLELIVQLHHDRVDVAERSGGELRWVASAPASLVDERVLRIRKNSRIEDPDETLTVWVDGTEVLRARGNGSGTLGVGRVVFGSLGYQSMGATQWRWIELDAEPLSADTVVPTETRSFGALKSEF
ncbi:MAG TPA: hypothetical protein VKA86_10075 [Candidatus Krumholzibacteria bacterium]|nr:hypothetical protein [Candidatus Krumholzibacteria bacterium]